MRKEDTWAEAGGQRSTAFEFVRTLDAAEVTDGKIEVVGPELDELEEGARVPLGIVVDVAGRKMQSDFEPVIERQFHHLMNFAEGVLHMGQRELIWLRISKAAKDKGFSFHHLGDILHAKLLDEFDAIVDKVQVTIYTEQAKVDEMLAIAQEDLRRSRRAHGASSPTTRPTSSTRARCARASRRATSAWSRPSVSACAARTTGSTPRRPTSSTRPAPTSPSRRARSSRRDRRVGGRQRLHPREVAAARSSG